MGPILSIASKEIRALFQSQIALLFLALFLFTTLFNFFALEGFFARNIADLRPFFDSLPLQLILLVGAISMRAWAEERKSGTLEVLLTLPVRTRDLVLGKFAAGMALVAMALLFTLPVPLTVSVLGPLDWGPVIGGYLGAMLLASAYLAIGLCVSARTDNQVLALMATLAIGGVLYVVGTDSIQALLGANLGEWAARIGSGSRFESIARGVVDLRDLVYYASLTAFFLVLNGHFLDRQRIDSQGQGANRLLNLQGIAMLALFNAVLANIWVTPIARARVDLTANGDYTISDVTERILTELDEPLRITGVFSERSHPLLQPKVPQMKALLQEYAITGGDHVTVEIVDPSTDDDLSESLDQDYGIQAVQMRASDRNEQRFVNAYFHVLVRYGDKHAVIDFGELVEIDATDGIPEVRLRDPEYDITKAIRKVSQDFVSLESLVKQLPGDSRITLYATPDVFDKPAAAELLSSYEAMKEVGEKIAEMSDNLTYSEVDPRSDEALVEEIAARYGVNPALSLTSGIYYLHLVLITGDEAQRIFPRGAVSASELERTVESAIKRAVPGQLKTVAVLTEIPQPPPPNPRDPRPPQAPPPDYQIVQQLLADRFEIKRELDITGGSVPDDVDVLIVGKPGKLSPTQQLAIDQFLLRGGNVIALAGRNRVTRGRLGFEKAAEDESLFAMLDHYGVSVGSELVADRRMGKWVMPIGRQQYMIDYPLWPVVLSDTFGDNLAMQNLDKLSAPWASPVTLAEELAEGLAGQVLFETTGDGWKADDSFLNPNPTLQSTPIPYFKDPTGAETLALGVVLEGRFPSFFTEDTRPEVPGALTTPVADGTLVVLGSAAMLEDAILQLGLQRGSGALGQAHQTNHLVLQNLIDWSLEDTDLLSIRNPGAFSRTLYPTDAETLGRYELLNYGLVLLPLPLLYFWSRRRRTPPKLARQGA